MLVSIRISGLPAGYLGNRERITEVGANVGKASLGLVSDGGII